MANIDSLAAKDGQVFEGTSADDSFTVRAFDAPTAITFRGDDGVDTVAFDVSGFPIDRYTIATTPAGHVHVTATLSTSADLLGVPFTVNKYVDALLIDTEVLRFYRPDGEFDYVQVSDLFGNPPLIGTPEADEFDPPAGDNSIDGLAGLDTVVLAGAQSDWSVARAEDDWAVSGLANQGVNTLSNIERVAFDDVKLALDVDDNALETLQFIGTVAPALQSSLEIRGLILGLLDTEHTMQTLSQLAIDIGLLPAENKLLAEHVINNVLPGVNDFDTLRDACVQYIGANGQVKFVTDVMAMNLNVDLVGLHQEGMAYL
jgi:hypothetical protein